MMRLCVLKDRFSGNMEDTVEPGRKTEIMKI